MRPIRIVAIAVVLALGASLGRTARADEEFDLSVAKGQITVTAHAGWHINKDYPWKLTVGDTKFEKAKFALAETTASVSGAPKGTATLKGAVCSAEQCHTFKKDLTIP